MPRRDSRQKKQRPHQDRHPAGRIRRAALHRLPIAEFVIRHDRQASAGEQERLPGIVPVEDQQLNLKTQKSVSVPSGLNSLRSQASLPRSLMIALSWGWRSRRKRPDPCRAMMTTLWDAIVAGGSRSTKPVPPAGLMA